MDIDKEKLLYILRFFEYEFETFIYNVLEDSKDDPHYSAVTATNHIKCYMQIMQELGEDLPFSNVKEYFDYCRFTKAEYIAFEKSRENESSYYTGVQY